MNVSVSKEIIERLHFLINSKKAKKCRHFIRNTYYVVRLLVYRGV